MKRLLLPAFVVAYAVLGAVLLTQMPRPDWSISGGKLIWDPYEKQMTVFVSSQNCVITMEEADFTRTKFVRQHPDGKVLVRITGGKPTILKGELKGALPDGIFLINPSGVIVGPDATVELGESTVLGTLDIGMEDFTEKTLDFSSDSKREVRQTLPEIYQALPSNSKPMAMFTPSPLKAGNRSMPTIRIPSPSSSMQRGI